MTGWQWHTEQVGATLRLDGWWPSDGAALARPDGAALLVVNEPAVREWRAGGILASAEPVAWSLHPDRDGTTMRTSAAAEVDLLELDASLAADARRPVQPMTVLGSFSMLEGVADLGTILVGPEVLDTNVFLGRRCPSEQTALSAYRIARHRGGRFWSAVADHLATVVRRRMMQASDGMLVHGVFGSTETHTRFVADAVLLLLAHGYDEAARRGIGALDALSVPWGGGRWIMHDSLERESGSNQLVLNTHVQATLARLAAGTDVGPELRALEVALPHVRSRAGRLARDVTGVPAPAYLTVNLHDLAGLCRNARSRAATVALRRGLAYAGLSGYFRAQRREGHPQCTVQPIALRLAHAGRAARRAAAGARAAGWAPAIGWPGFTDALWPALADGTP